MIRHMLMVAEGECRPVPSISHGALKFDDISGYCETMGRNSGLHEISFCVKTEGHHILKLGSFSTLTL